MKQYITIPAKVIPCDPVSITGTDFWPYNSGDPYWQFGLSPKNYRWQVIMTVSMQTHSSPLTRQPNAYTGMDVDVGDYIADSINGVAVKIVDIQSKSDTGITCTVEDVFRYNTFRDPTGFASGVFSPSSSCVIFSLNEEGQPVVDPATSAILSGNFYNNLSSRFQNLEQNYNFILHKVAHGYSIGQVIAADVANATFTLSSPNHPYLVGTVSDVQLGPDDFAINPFEKTVNQLDYLPGNVASIIYADDTNPGQISLTGAHPVMIQLSVQANTVVTGTVAGANTVSGNTFTLNGQSITIGNVGSAADFVASVNAFTTNTGISASTAAGPSVATATDSPVGFLQVPGSASIDGVTVNFSTTTDGFSAFGVSGYADMNDLATDINAASIPNIVADVFSGTFGTQLRLTNSTGNAITVVNISNDVSGNPFAGTSSSTGLTLSTPASTTLFVVLAAPDARPINLYDTLGSPTSDFGLQSGESGVKASALYIDQGVRKAATYVVANISARDALNALIGDQCFVQDVGDGTWAYYLLSFDSAWVMVSNQPSSETDAQSIEVTVTPSTANSAVIHTITNGRRVTFVTVTVNQAFDAPATISVGDSSQNDRLMTTDQNDLTVVADYSTTPSYTYTTGVDTPIKFYFNAAGATQGNAVVAITYT